MRYLLFILCLFAALNSKGQIITTVAGDGFPGTMGDGGPATAARIPASGGGIFDTRGNYYFTERIINRIRKISKSGIISHYVGTGVAGSTGDGGPASTATLNSPCWIGLDKFDNLYIPDQNNYKIRKVDASTGIISTFAGTGTPGTSGNGGMAISASFLNPYAVAIDSSSNVYIYDATDRTIRKVSPSGIISAYAGISGSSGYSGDGGPATNATLVAIQQIYAAKNGDLYLAGDVKIRKINSATGIITTIAGNGVAGYSGDNGPATNAQISSAYALALDVYNKLYIAEKGNNVIRMLDTFGIIHTIAGNGTSGYSGDGGPATSAQLNWPEGIAFDLCGNLYFNDLSNYRIRKVSLPPIYTFPSIALSGATIAAPGSSVTVTAAVSGTGSGYIIYWMNHGIVFNTTTVPSVIYTKGVTIDTITARIVSTDTTGCYDTTTSAGHIVVPAGLGMGVPGVAPVYIYPNPTNDLLNIELQTTANYTLLSVVGNTLQQGQLHAGSNTISLADLPTGIYLVALTGACGERSVTRILKQ